MAVVRRRVRSRAMMGLSALILAVGTLMLGGSPAGATLNTGVFFYTGPVVPIADSPGVNVPGPRANANLPVSGMTGTINDMALFIGGSACSDLPGSTTVGIDHSFVNDLVVTLVSPSGTRVDVIDRVDGGGNNFCQTELYDGATHLIDDVATADAPFTGLYQPSHPLGAFKGEPANGTWHLQARDYFTGDTGNIRSFSLEIETDTQPSVKAQSSVPQGGCVTLSAEGLGQATNYGVSIGRGTFLRNVITDNIGAFSESVCIPRSTPVGTQVVSVSGGSPSQTVTTTVQVTRG